MLIEYRLAANPSQHKGIGFEFRHSDFEFDSSFGFRISDFAFRVSR